MVNPIKSQPEKFALWPDEASAKRRPTDRPGSMAIAEYRRVAMMGSTTRLAAHIAANWDLNSPEKLSTDEWTTFMGLLPLAHMTQKSAECAQIEE